MSESVDKEIWMKSMRERFEREAFLALTSDRGSISGLVEPMRYSALSGGKRVRALLAYAAGELTGATLPNLDLIAQAIEFVHAYSLIHDDLPAMDNDSLRRGKPTCHVQYGVGIAMLAGDALQPEAFLRLLKLDLPAEQVVAIVQELAYASGKDGMCGGQYIDLSHVGEKLDLPLLREMHLMKTGALIHASLLMGAQAGKKALFDLVAPEIEALSQALGLGFQVIDDILDVTSDAATLGKTAGKDALNDKPTYVTLLGLEKAKALANETKEKASLALKAMRQQTEIHREAIDHLRILADFIFGREN